MNEDSYTPARGMYSCHQLYRAGIEESLVGIIGGILAILVCWTPEP